MRCPHYKRKPGESRLHWKEHLKRGTRQARALRKGCRGIGRLIGTMLSLGISSSKAASAFKELSDAWHSGGNYSTGTEAGLARIEASDYTGKGADAVLYLSAIDRTVPKEIGCSIIMSDEDSKNNPNDFDEENEIVEV